MDSRRFGAYTADMWESILIAATGLVLLVVGQMSLARARRLKRILRAVVERNEEPILVYDHRNHLVFHSGGLVVFDQNALKDLKHWVPGEPADRPATGELVIDSNRYRYHTSRIEFAPQQSGTIVVLDYQGSATAH